MNKNQQRITYLLEWTRQGRLSDRECDEILQWLNKDHDANDEKLAIIQQYYEAQQLNAAHLADHPSWKSIPHDIIAVEKEVLSNRLSLSNKPASILNINWLRYIAAAIIVLAIGSGVYYFNHQSWKSYKSVESQFKTITAAPDIPPGTNKAILTLSNGTQKQLSASDNGLHLQSDAVLLTTPNGGQYQAVLPDGSKVWLNAASSIKFPSKFGDKERRVEVTGEAYFEIAKDAVKPFKVSGGGQEIEVLGTSFNVNAYNDEPAVKTTLVTGSIKINHTILQPGEAFYKGKIINANIEQDLAWKNGTFHFNNTTLPEIMRQLERWYDVEVIYKNGIPSGEYNGKPSRNLNLSQMLQLIAWSGVRFTIEGKKIIVE